MIYKDNFSVNDDEFCPQKREGNCVNCGKPWSMHSGWSCNPCNVDRSFYSIDGCNRYLVQSMIDSIKEKAIAVKIEKSNDGWRVWAHNKPGDCPCAINANKCDYHRDNY